MADPEWVRRWIDKGDDDLDVARLALGSGGIKPWVICFHAQQATEKWLKAAIAATDAEPPYSHNLVMLAGWLPAGLVLPASAEALGTLTTYATTARYVPSDVPDEPDPTIDDAKVALETAEAVRLAVSDWLLSHASDRDATDKPEVRGGA
jgi:HEPN domain-containing protein